jgi:hypothetical protein
VFRVVGLYAVVAWVTLQVVVTVAPILNLPDWTARFTLVLLVIGLQVRTNGLPSGRRMLLPIAEREKRHGAQE